MVSDDIRNCLKSICDIIETARSRTLYSCLLKNDSTSDEYHIAKAEAFLRSRGIQDHTTIQESVIHNIKGDIEKLLMRKVWLKSGAFLIIEQLESFNAIDVNTGKAISGKQDITCKVNMEAADEITL